MCWRRTVRIFIFYNIGGEKSIEWITRLCFGLNKVNKRWRERAKGKNCCQNKAVIDYCSNWHWHIANANEYIQPHPLYQLDPSSLHIDWITQICVQKIATNANVNWTLKFQLNFMSYDKRQIDLHTKLSSFNLIYKPNSN